MKDELKKELYIKFPNIFPKETHAFFSHGDGWFDIISSLCDSLTVISESIGIGITALQTKAKFKTLRFYVDIDTTKATCDEIKLKTWCDIINNLIRWTEIRSFYVCEMCGSISYGPPQPSHYCKNCEENGKE
jgi:hypothetical protein